MLAEYAVDHETDTSLRLAHENDEDATRSVFHLVTQLKRLFQIQQCDHALA